ncbi:MAG: hypothetical protein K5656_04350, partial [Lachnospiraceae bacterium]|nr:hypothetical protein [Lachnospiraceae bacterium]
MHYETRAANSVKKAKSTVQQSQSFAQPSQTVNVERAHPEVKVQSVSTPSAAREQASKASVNTAPNPQPMANSGSVPPYLGGNGYKDDMPVEDELDELDEIFLDE